MLNFFSRRERKKEIMKLLRVSLRVNTLASTQLCRFPSFKSFKGFEGYANRNPNFLVELHKKGSVLSLGELADVLRSYLQGDFRDPYHFRAPPIFKTFKERPPLSFDQAVTSYHLMVLLTSEMGLHESDVDTGNEKSLINNLLNFIVDSYPDLALARLESNYHESERYYHKPEGSHSDSSATGVVFLPADPIGNAPPGLDSSIFRELTRRNNLLKPNLSLAAFSTSDLPLSIFSKFATVFVETQDPDSAAKVISMVALNQMEVELEKKHQLLFNPWEFWQTKEDLRMHFISLDKGVKAFDALS